MEISVMIGERNIHFNVTPDEEIPQERSGSHFSLNLSSES